MSQESKSPSNTLKKYYDLSGCTYAAQSHFRRRLAKLAKQAEPSPTKVAALEEDIENSRLQLQRRQQLELNIQYPESLPVAQKAKEIQAALEANQVLIVAGETGSGKTTQLPKICLQAGFGRRGLIGHTQPRRLAARTVSARIAEELGSELGNLVGYQVRFTDQSNENSLVKVMTDGILLAEIKRDRQLYRYEVIIIDEAHERSLNIDFLLGYLKQLLIKRPELKVIVTSATIDVERFAKHFDNAPIISVTGRSFPVQVEYRPAAEREQQDLSFAEQIVEVVEEIKLEEKRRAWPVGDVLVFLAGEREIRETSNYLRHCDLKDTEVTPLYARLSNEEQGRIFKSHRGRRIVLATNVAETSITVPGIRYVIDSGQVRMSRYSYRSKIQRLPIEAVSQASANQRKGRCGRVAEGICYRLYSEEDFLARPEFTDPEILRTNLASVILKMIDAGLGDVMRFPFIDMPDNRLWNDGFKLLFELGVVDQHKRLTPSGRQLASFPVDPRLAKMLLVAVDNNCLDEMLIIVSALSIQDPRERPGDKQQAADQAHAQFRDEESDFVSLLNLWYRYEQQRQELSGNQLKRFCQKNFLSYLRMREWRDLHRQVHLLSKGLNSPRAVKRSQQVSPAPVEQSGASPERPVQDMPTSEKPGSRNYDLLHQAIVAGLLGNIGRHDEKREYHGCRNRRFQVFPGSALHKKRPKWLVSAELLETSLVYGRTNARIDPAWIEPLAAHLVKKSWSEPHWQKKRGQVIAYEKVSLYGLDIVTKRPVNFGNIDPVIAREIFIRAALVEGDYVARAEPIKHNQALLSEIEQLEDRTRRRDIVVDDEVIFELYQQRIPGSVVSAPSFEKWFKKLTPAEQLSLRFNKEELTRQQAPDVEAGLFPDTLENNGIRFPLRYHFDPTADNDGVTISVPLQAARQITAGRLEKLVPGLLREKCTQLIKNLPRALRKKFVPVPDVVAAIFPQIEASEEPLLETMSLSLKQRTGVTVPLEAWDSSLLDKHLRFNVEVLDDSGKVVEQGRDLLSVIAKVEHLIDQPSAASSQQADNIIKMTDWDFDRLEAEQSVERAGIRMRMFPALKDARTHVEHMLCVDAQQASHLSRLGIARLLAFRLRTQLATFERVIPEYKKMGLLYAPIGPAKGLYDDFKLACIADHFLQRLPSNKDEFEHCYQQHRGDFVARSEVLASLVHKILLQHHQLMKALKGKVNLAIALPLADLNAQLQHLLYEGFLSQTPLHILEHFPRYLDACSIRFEKMPRELANERQYLPKLKNWWQQYQLRRQQLESQGIWDAELEKFRWMMEEQRVSWYAQQLGTLETVSEKRLEKQWKLVRRA